ARQAYTKDAEQSPARRRSTRRSGTASWCQWRPRRAGARPPTPAPGWSRTWHVLHRCAGGNWCRESSLAGVGKETELRVAEEAAGRRRHRQHQPVTAIQEAATDQVDAHERPEAMAEGAEDGGALAARVHHGGGIGRIAIDLGDQRVQVGVRVMLQMAAQPQRLALRHDALVHGRIVEARGAALEEPQHVVGPPAAMADEAAAEIRQ